MAGDTSALPDDVSRGRALTCAALHAAGVAPVVVFTGAGNDTLSAAEAMAAVAAEAGMPPQAMIVEPEAHSTIQNAAFGLALLPEAPERLVRRLRRVPPAARLGHLPHPGAARD
jgi:hypothetical protein